VDSAEKDIRRPRAMRSFSLEFSCGLVF
jgi:hypothetical protein